MKKTLYFIAAITMAASSAMASKARVSALSNSPAITDIQNIFANPADMHYVGDFATFEFGEVSGSAASAADISVPTLIAAPVPNAEGGFIETMGNSKFGFYLGKMSPSTNIYRAYAGYALTGDTTTAAFLQQENPFELFYGSKAGDLNWGASFTYSNSSLKNGTGSADDQSQSAMGVRMGVKTDDWGAYANIGLGSDAKVGAAKFTSKSGLTLGGHYMMDTVKIYGKFDNAGAKADDTAGVKVWDADYTELTVGFTNTWKSDGNLAFYGLALVSRNDKFDEVGNVTAVMGAGTFADKTKKDVMSLPFTMGAEVLATSWMKLRGSVTQNVLLGTTKTKVDGTTFADSTTPHNTTTAAGAGFIWGHNTMDIVMTMGTNANLDSSTLGTNASYTYNF